MDQNKPEVREGNNVYERAIELRDKLSCWCGGCSFLYVSAVIDVAGQEAIKTMPSDIISGR
jgi:hypothetical protein